MMSFDELRASSLSGCGSTAYGRDRRSLEPGGGPKAARRNAANVIRARACLRSLRASATTIESPLHPGRAIVLTTLFPQQEIPTARSASPMWRVVPRSGRGQERRSDRRAGGK